MRTLDRIISNLPAQRRVKVTARARKLIAKAMLRHLRQVRQRRASIRTTCQ
jgi:hypothetical protein